MIGNNVFKVFLLISFVALSVLTTKAQGIEFIHDFDVALQKAKLENKLIFIDFYTSWCAPCKVLDKEVFSQEKAGEFFNSNFINCKIQCDDKGLGVVLGEKYKVVAYPTLMFVDGNGKMVHSKAGTLSVEELIILGEIAMDPERNLMFDTKQWEAGNREDEFVLQYFKRLKEAYQFEQAKSDFLDYFFKLSKTEKKSKRVFKLIEIIGAEPFTPLFVFIEENKSGFYKSVDKVTIDNFISKSYLSYLNNLAIYKKDDYKVKLQKFKEKKYSYFDEYRMFCNVFLFTKDINEFMNQGTEFLPKYGTNNDDYTISLTLMLGNLTGKPDQGKDGIAWMENLLKRNPDPAYLSTYFYILWRNFQFDKALEVGDKMRANAIKNGESTDSINEQIKMVKDAKAKYKR